MGQIGERFHKSYMKKINIKIKFIEVQSNAKNIGTVFSILNLKKDLGKFKKIFYYLI
jgi:hypothetical protein